MKARGVSPPVIGGVTAVHYPTGTSTPNATGGDFLLVHHDTLTGAAIRTGERLRYRSPDPASRRWRGFAYWNHAVMVLDEEMTAQATGRGIVETPLSAWDHVDYAHCVPSLTADERVAITEYALWCVGERYSFVTIPFLALNYLTGMGVEVGLADHQICSGYVASCLFKGPFIWPQDPTFLSPADLACLCNVRP